LIRIFDALVSFLWMKPLVRQNLPLIGCGG
jgi:hypothetical protein